VQGRDLVTFWGALLLILVALAMIACVGLFWWAA